MKKILLSVLFLQISLLFFGQNINDLDSKNGFKDFTIGDPFSKWEKNIQNDGIWDDGSPSYLYNGSCCNKLFNYDVERIKLRFNKGQLVGIYITTKKFQKEYIESGEFTKWRKDDFENIKMSFSMLFGPPTSFLNDEETSEVSYTWIGKKVGLISTYQYLGVRNGDRQQISIVSLSYLQETMKNGF